MLSHHPSQLIGGAAIADHALAGGLRDLGHEVELLFFDPLLPTWIRGTARLLAFPWWAAWAAFKRRRKLDVIESTAGDAWLARRVLTLFDRRPLLSIRTHGLEHRRAELDRRTRETDERPPSPSTAFYHYRYRLLEVADDLRSADCVFFLNTTDADFAREELGVDPRRIHVQPNGVDSRLADSPSPPFADRSQRILFIGAWSAAKGADLLPSIASMVLTSYPRAALTCAGIDCDPGLAADAFDVAVRDRVEILPRFGRQDLPALLARHGIFVQPSVAEGCSLALLEAMAAGLVPVTTASGYATELITPGTNGLLCERTAAAFTAAIFKLLDGVEEASRLASNARSAVAGHSWTQVARDREAVWCQHESTRVPKCDP